MSELQEQIQNRRRKLEELAREGVELYPHAFAHDQGPSEVRAEWRERAAEELEAEKRQLRVRGRLLGIRGHGKVMFLDLADGQGKPQPFVRRAQRPAGADQVLH